MPAPRDTTKDGFLLGVTPVEAIEAVGQRELVESTALPIKTTPPYGDPHPSPYLPYEALGFTFGDQVDEPFIEATLPEGWSKQPTEHSMWSSIKDERGVERVAVFYKAAPYDRRAYMRLKDVGQSAAHSAVVGHEHTPWSVMTNDERAKFLATIEDWAERAEKDPDLYDVELPNIIALRDKYGGD